MCLESKYLPKEMEFENLGCDAEFTCKNGVRAVRMIITLALLFAPVEVWA